MAGIATFGGGSRSRPASLTGVLVLAALGLAGCGDVPPPVVPAPDLDAHPLYSTYDFGKSGAVVDIGIQPLWVPTCIITEVMKRDGVLVEALAGMGMEVRFHAFLKGADINFFLQRGDLEAGIVGDMPALTAAAESGALVAALVQQGYCAIVAKRYGFVCDLRGKRVGYAFGSNAHYALLEALSAVGVEEKDLLLVPLDVHEMPDALERGSIDAYSAWEPTPTLSLARFEDHVVIHRSLTSGYLYFSRPFADANDKALRHVTASALRAAAWLFRSHENLSEASQWALEAGAEVSEEVMLLSKEDYVTLAGQDILGLTSVPMIPENDLAPGGPLFKEFEFLKTLGRIDSAADWSDIRACFDRGIIPDVLSERAKYRLREGRRGGAEGLEPTSVPAPEPLE